MISFFGHSHLAAIQAAYHQYEESYPKLSFIQLNAPEYQPSLIDSKAVLPDKVLYEIERTKTLNGQFVLSIGGAFHNVLALTNHPVPFSITEYVEGKVFLPPSVFSLTMRHQLNWQLQILTSLAEIIKPKSFIQLQSPPPIDDENYLSTMPGVYEEQINQNGIMPAADRFMAWKIQSNIFEHMTISFGGRFVPAPKSMVTKTGFLIEKPGAIRHMEMLTTGERCSNNFET